MEKSDAESYTPSKYLADRERVMEELAQLGGEDREAAQKMFQQRLKDRLYGLQDKEVIEVDGQKIVLAAGDPFIAMAAEGFEGGISKTGKDGEPGTMYFVASANLSDETISKLGLAPAFAELYDPAIQGMKRVETNSDEAKKGRLVYAKPDQLALPLQERMGALKRIGAGFMLAYQDKELAKKLLATELKDRSH